VIQAWRAANPSGNAEGSYGRMVQVNSLMEMLLDNDRSRRTAIALLVVGAVIGALGNYLSQSW
jgi:hypothetical protein